MYRAAEGLPSVDRPWWDPPVERALSRRLFLAGASAALAAGAGLGVMRWLRRGVYALPTESDVIIDAVEIQGARLNLLRAGLRGARVVVPDRPHDPRDAIDPRARAAMRRRRVFTVDSNEDRLRGRRALEETGRPRTLLLGDSVAFGWGVEERASLGARLAAALGSEVLVAGVPGMRPAQVAVWAGHLLQRIEVDQVLLVIRPREDEVPALGPLWREVERRGRARRAHVLSPLSTFDLRGARSLGSLASAVRAASPGVPVLEGTEIMREQPPGDGVVLHAEGLRQELRDARTGEVRLRAEGEPERPAEAILAAFEADGALREPYFFDGGHLDEEGSERFARAIADFLVSAG